jgi:hypothetical protein
VDDVFIHFQEFEEPMPVELTNQLRKVMPSGIDFAMQRVRKLHMMWMPSRWPFWPFYRLTNIEEN